MESRARSHRDVKAWQKSMEFALAVRQASAAFAPLHREFAMELEATSRVVPARIAEAWRKRRIIAAFVTKISDAEASLAAVQTYLDMALRSGFIDETTHQVLDGECESLMTALGAMIDKPEDWVPSTPRGFQTTPGAGR